MRKKYVRKRGLNYRTRVRIPNYIAPDYALVKLKDRTTLTLSGFSLTNGRLTAYASLRGNDMRNLLGLANPLPNDVPRPTGFDEWMSLYREFIVHQSAVKVTPIAYQTSGEDEVTQHLPFRVVVVPFQGGAGLITTGGADPTELAYSRSKVYNGNSLPVVDASGAIVSNADAGNTTIRGVFSRMSTKKILGYKDLSDVQEVRGSISNSPDVRGQWGWAIYVETLIPTTLDPNDYSMVLEVQIYYKSQFIGRQQIVRDS